MFRINDKVRRINIDTNIAKINPKYYNYLINMVYTVKGINVFNTKEYISLNIDRGTFLLADNFELVERSPSQKLNKVTRMITNEAMLPLVSLPTCKENDPKFFENTVCRILFHEPATIIFWSDGSKTVLKPSPNDTYDKEKAVLWAFFLKYGGNSKTQLKKLMRRLCEGVDNV